MHSWRCCRLFTIMLLTGLVLPPSLRAEQDNCLTCHPDNMRGNGAHAPMAKGECSVCHQTAAVIKHPGDKNSVALSGKGFADFCRRCHKTKVAVNIHAPVISGDCSACHNPHQSLSLKLLKKQEAALCYTCHEEEQFRNKFRHGPIAGGNCIFCHEPHSSDRQKLLKRFGAALCFDCHDSSLANGASVHEPVGYGDCIACHAPHGSVNRKLLIDNFAEQFYMPYSSARYELCFNCHKKELAEEQTTDSFTDFRNGNDNLHYLHINKADKGRSCKACHDAHSADQQKLIKEKVPGFGKWDIPIYFVKESTGGTCVVGCHKPKTYDRNVPVVYR